VPLAPAAGIRFDISAARAADSETIALPDYFRVHVHAVLQEHIGESAVFAIAASS
jgi:hypothetical protein